MRLFEIPPAPPWDQHEAARLNAQRGSPLPPGDAAICVRRLTPWRPGQPGLFCAAYLRRSQITGEHDLFETVDGRPVYFSFRTARLARAQLRRRVLDVGLGVLMAASLGSATLKALSLRQDNAVAIRSAEDSVLRSLAAQRALERQVRLGRLLQGEGVTGRNGASLMGDLAWLSQRRRPESRLQAVSWNGGELRIVASGVDPPFQAPDRAILAEGTSGPGGAVWRVQRAAPAVGPAAPMSPPSP